MKKMARSCCRRVYQHEEDMKVIELEEKHFKTLHTDFCVQAGKFKELAKRVYKSLNVLWYSAQGMHSSDSRRAVYLEVVIKISINWYNVDTRIRKEYQGMSLLSKTYPDTPLRLVLDEIEFRASMTEVEFNKQLLWDSNCREQLVGAFQKIVTRASRLLDGDWLIRYYIFFEQANPRLAEYDDHLTLFFRQWVAGTLEDYPVEVTALRTQMKPPHDLAFSHVAQLLSSGYLDGERPEPELLDLSIKKSEDQQAEDNEISKSQDANSNEPKGDEHPQLLEIMNAVATENIFNQEGNETAKSQETKPNVPNYDEKLRSLEKEKAVVPDNIALAIERVVANCREDDEPECVDLTDSPVKPKPAPASRRKRQATKKASPQEVATESTTKEAVQQMPTVESKSPAALENAGTVTAPKPLVMTSIMSVNIPISMSNVTVAAMRLPNTQGIAKISTESDKATVGQTWTVLRPIPRRFLNARTLTTNSSTAEHAANQLRLGFAGGNGETGPIALGALFEKLYRPDVPGLLHYEQGLDSNHHGPVFNQLGSGFSQHWPGAMHFGPHTNKQGQSPSQQGSVVKQSGPSPNQQESVLKQQGSVLKHSGPSPNQQGPVVNQQGPVVKQQGSGPNQQGPVVKQLGPSPNQKGSVLKQQGPSPNQQGPVVKQLGPSPNQKGPMTKQKGPGPNQQGSVVKQQGPSPNQKGSVVKQSVPSPNQQGPVVKQLGPSPNQKGPMTKQQGPSPNQKGSVLKQQGPVVKEQGPVVKEQGPGPIQQGTVVKQLGPSSNQKGPMAKQQGPMAKQQGPMAKQQGPSTSKHDLGLYQNVQLKSLLQQPSTNVPKADVADAGQGPACGVRGHASKCAGHLVPFKPQPNVAKKAVESSRPVQRPFGPNFVGSGFVMHATKRKRQAINELVEQGTQTSGAEKVNDADDNANSTKLAGKKTAAKRRLVVNGRQPFKEIRPKPTKTPDVDVPATGAAVQPSTTNMYLIRTDKSVHVLSGDNLFKPYKLELQMNADESAKPKVLGMKATAPATASASASAVASAPASAGGVVPDVVMQAKKYDFRSRPRAGQEGNEDKSDDQPLMKPTIKMRKDLFSKRDPE